MTNNTDFLLLCRQFYFEGLTPSNKINRFKKEYDQISNIALKYFSENKYAAFLSFFQEGQYFVGLWAAHLLIDYGNPTRDMVIDAIKIIKEYSDNPLAPDVAKEESEWLKLNKNKFMSLYQINL